MTKVPKTCIADSSVMLGELGVKKGIQGTPLQRLRRSTKFGGSVVK